ncbi:MAG: hypothetical protein HY791_12175 [Deltaproteobacteria bacterium]|nr:hypothetical protein [Deltaproteobacteria bacterium]
MRTLLAPALVALLLSTGCPDDPSPLDRLDGNVVVGDARPIDASDASDAGDSQADGPDGGELDADGLEHPDREQLDDLDVGTFDAGPTCGRPPELTLTALEALARAPELSGHVVDVVGTATISVDLVCSSSAAACQATCRASVDVVPGLRLLPGPCAMEVGCQGTDCDLVCRPLTGVARRFRGQLTSTGSAGLYLEAVLAP